MICHDSGKSNRNSQKAARATNAGRRFGQDHRLVTPLQTWDLDGIEAASVPGRLGAVPEIENDLGQFLGRLQ